MQDNYIIQFIHEGLPCWHIVRAPRLKEPLINKLQTGVEVDISSIGEILESGWGSDIPEETKRKYGLNAMV
jgi:hypothetical protein